MQVEIRLAQSGHTYRYGELKTVLQLMQIIKNEFKNELQDQQIITKSGQTLNSSQNFSNIKEIMKKTLSSNINPNIQNQQNHRNIPQEIQVLYVYNKKQLLKPIEVKPFDDELELKNLKQKCKQLLTFTTQNTFESKKFFQKVNQKNINSIIQFMNKKLKTPLQNATQRLNNFIENLRIRNYSKFQIPNLLQLVQNQDKARKLLIRNIYTLLQKKTKKRFNNINQKIIKEEKQLNQIVLKENSSFFSGSKNISNQKLTQLNRLRFQIQNKLYKYQEKLKQQKKSVLKQKFSVQQKMTFQIEKKHQSSQKQFQQSLKYIKIYYDQFFQELIKVYNVLTRCKQKQGKQIYKNLFELNQKILTIESRVFDNINGYTQMYIDLTKIHRKGQNQDLKVVFQIYVKLTKSLQSLNQDIRKYQKQFQSYRNQRDKQAQVSQFNQSKNKNMPFKKKMISPKKEKQQSQKIKQKQQGSITKQIQGQILKINSPLKSKVCKSKLKSFNQQFTARNFQLAIKQNRQLGRRLDFNKRLQGLMKYCSNICQKQQQYRRNFRNSKQFQDNKIDLLTNFNVPNIEIDYKQTTDIQLTHLYKRWRHQNCMELQYSPSISWQKQLIQTSNEVSKTLTVYFASKSNTSQKQKNIEKILCLLSTTFYKMMNIKLQSQTKTLRQTLNEQFKLLYESQIQQLKDKNIELSAKIQQLQKNLQINKNQQFVDLKQQFSDLKNLSESFKIKQIQRKHQQLCCIDEELQNQNQELKQKIITLETQLLNYKQEMEDITQKLITSVQQSNNSEEIEAIKNQLAKQKQTNANLNKDYKDIKVQLQKAKKNLIKQVETSQLLYKQMQQICAQKQFYQREFPLLKDMLADRQVTIIKLQKQISSLKSSITEVTQTQSNNQTIFNSIAKQPTCQCSQIIIELRQDKQQLEQEVQHLDKELKQILFKQTQQQQTQTQIQEAQSNIKLEPSLQQKQKQNFNENFTSNNQTHKILDHKILHQNVQNTKRLPHHITPAGNESLTLNQNNVPNYYSQQAVSQYYVSSMAHHWLSGFNLNKFTPISLGNTVEQGMYHLFLPFANDLYIGVTISEQQKNFTSYQNYLNLSEQNSMDLQPIYILDTKEFNQKTRQMLKQCSLVLVVKIENKQLDSMSRKVLVSGKIQYALGFEDDEMSIKNYSNFLAQ